VGFSDDQRKSPKEQLGKGIGRRIGKELGITHPHRQPRCRANEGEAKVLENTIQRDEGKGAIMVMPTHAQLRCGIKRVSLHHAVWKPWTSSVSRSASEARGTY